MKLNFYGTRGSIATPSSRTFKTEEYGGNTTSMAVTTSDGKLNLIDAGTGIRAFGNALLAGDFGKGKGVANLFFTHVHWDHIQGVPFFTPFFIPGNIFNLYGLKKVNTSLERTLEGQQQYPNFPVTLEQMRKIGANMSFVDLVQGACNFNGVNVSCTELNHPDGVLCYSFEDNGKKIVIATDTEHDGYKFNQKFGPIDSKLLWIAKDADILVYDAQYTPEEYEKKKTWGHSTFEKGIDIALEAGVKKIVLTHHDPSHDDRMLDEISERAKGYCDSQFNLAVGQKIIPVEYSLDVVMAKEGMEIGV